MGNIYKEAEENLIKNNYRVLEKEEIKACITCEHMRTGYEGGEYECKLHKVLCANKDYFEPRIDPTGICDKYMSQI